jgi:hypothetical protein
MYALAIGEAMETVFSRISTMRMRVLLVRDSARTAPTHQRAAGHPERIRDRRVRSQSTPPWTPTPVFLFFSNRLGWAGSLVISLVATIIILLILGIL